MIKFGNKAVSFNNKWVKYDSVPPVPPGPSFPSVKIGNQIWMSENLSVDDGGEGILIFNNVNPSPQIELGPQTYYTWDAAMRVANSIPGWHLPSQEEYNILRSIVNYNYASSARSTYGWSRINGTNESGFNVLPCGYCSNGTSLSSVGSNARCWTSTSNSTRGCNLIVRDSNQTNSFDVSDWRARTWYETIRLIKNEE